MNHYDLIQRVANHQLMVALAVNESMRYFKNNSAPGLKSRGANPECVHGTTQNLDPQYTKFPSGSVCALAHKGALRAISRGCMARAEQNTAAACDSRPPLTCKPEGPGKAKNQHARRNREKQYGTGADRPRVLGSPDKRERVLRPDHQGAYCQVPVLGLPMGFSFKNM